jgi:hypothetical protein
VGWVGDAAVEVDAKVVFVLVDYWKCCWDRLDSMYLEVTQ